MRLVERASIAPARCAVIPFIGGRHERGYVDSGAEIPPSALDSHVYVSVVAVEQMAALIGWTPPDEAAELRADVDRLAAEVARLEQELSEADVYVKAIDTLESAGFRARKKPGRPRKESEEVAA